MNVAPASTLLAAAIGTCVVIYLIQTILADFCAMRTLWLVKDMRRVKKIMRKKIMRRVNMSGTMTDQDFLNRGFKQFPPIPQLDSEAVETHFQKRYDDEVGKRYFITVNKRREFKHPYTGEEFPATYEYSVQLYKKDGRWDAKAVDFLFHSTWSVDEVEEQMKKLFETGWFGYYEKWEDC